VPDVLRTVAVRISVTKITITIAVGDEIVVIELPLTNVLAAPSAA
jgi:hypothetical protein